MEAFNNILVIKSGALGDLIAGTTALRAVRNAYPNATITVLSNPLMLEICPAGTLIDQLVTYESGNMSIPAYVRLLRELRRHTFDLAINLRWSSEFCALLTRISGAHVRLGSGPKYLRWIYSHPPPLHQGRRHEFLRHLDIVRALGIGVGEPEPFVYISDEDRQFASRFLSSRHCTPRRALLVHPGASTPSKTWIPSRFGDIGRRFVDQFHAPVIVTWGPNEEELATAVVGRIGEYAHLAPRTTIGQLSAIIESAGLAICNYSGVMNVAMAVNTPMVALGCTSAEDWGPYGSLHRTVNSAREDDSYTEDDRGAAMRRITVEDVWSVVHRRWKELLQGTESMSLRT